MTRLYVGSSDQIVYPCIIDGESIVPSDFTVHITDAEGNAVTLLNSPLWSIEEGAYLIPVDPADVPVEDAGTQWKVVVTWKYTTDDGFVNTTRDVIYIDIVDDDIDQSRAYTTWATVKTAVRRLLEEPLPMVWDDDTLLSAANDGAMEIAGELNISTPSVIDAEGDVIMLPRYAISPLRDYILTKAFEQVGDFERTQVYRNDYEAALVRAKKRSQQERRVVGSSFSDVW